METEEVGVVGEERGLEVSLDTCEVDSVVFHAGVIAHDGEAEDGEQKCEDDWREGASLSQNGVTPVVRA